MNLNYKLFNVNLRIGDDLAPFPTVPIPKNVGVYSVSPEGQFENCNKRMRFFQLPVTCPFALRTKNNKPRQTTGDDDDEFCAGRSYLDTLLLFLISSRERRKLIPDTEFVCSRDVLVLLMCSPYNLHKNWTIAVSRYGNKIYMSQVPQEQEEENVRRPYDTQRIQQSLKNTWHKTLNEHCLVSKVESLNGIEAYEQRAEKGQLYGVFTMNYDGMRLLFDAPVIVEKSSNQFIGEPLKFVDLQMRVDTMNGDEWRSHNQKEVLLWWAQCFITGIQNIYVAHHDSDAIVHRFQNLMVRHLHHDCRALWSPNTCANFLSRFLSALKQLMASVDSPSAVYLFEYEAEQRQIKYAVLEDCNEYSFIPDWYLKRFDAFKYSMPH